MARLCVANVYPFAPFAEQLETHCVTAAEGPWCTDVPMNRDRKHCCHWQMKILWTGEGQRAKSVPPQRISPLSPAVGDCWLDYQPRG